MDRKFRLGVQLTPRSSWGKNLRSRLSKQRWSTLRDDALAGADNKCELCDAGEPLHCHEAWQYDDAQGIQRLAGLRVVCEDCHAVHHLGRTLVRGGVGNRFLEHLVEHFLHVNGCTREDFLRHAIEQLREYKERSQREWSIDLGAYAELVEADHGSELSGG
jgi:hypothetical protein